MDVRAEDRAVGKDVQCFDRVALSIHRGIFKIWWRDEGQPRNYGRCLNLSAYLRSLISSLTIRLPIRS